MLNKALYTIGIVLITVTLAACSSPEEKAASYIESANTMFAEGDLNKAEIEYKNALQINQNLPEALYGLAKIYERKKAWREAFAVVSKIREMAPQHVDGRIMLAQILLATNQLDQALSDAIEIKELAPEDPRSYSLMAAVQFRLENNEGALQEADKSLALDPGNNDAILVRARVFISDKKYSQALRLLEKAIEQSPDNVSLYILKIQIYTDQADPQSVRGVYSTLIDRFPKETAFKTALTREYIKDNKIGDAERLLEQIVDSDPGNIEQKLRLLVFKYQYRSSDEAITLANSYIDSDKYEYRYRLVLGELYERNQQFEEAVNVYRKIVEDDQLEANGLEARNKIALIDLRSGRSEEAARLVNEVLTHDNANKNALLLQARLQLAEQKYDDALISARTVLRGNPDSIRALELIGRAYDAMGSPDLAVESYHKAFQLNPGTATNVNLLAKNLIRQGNFTQTDEILLQSIANGNRSLETVQLLAQVKLVLGQWDEAEMLSKELQNVEGQEVFSQQLLGIVHQGKDDQQASIEAFKRAHELAPRSIRPIAALVQTYMRNGKLDEARRFLESVISVDDDNLSANLLLARLFLHQSLTAEALEQYKKVIKITPGLDVAYHDMASIYINQNNLDEAERVTQQGLSALPDKPSLLMDLATIYEMKGDIGQAIVIYESLLQKFPGFVVARNNLASLLTDHYSDAFSLERARDTAAVLKGSSIPQFRDTYAWAMVKADTNLEEAIAMLEGIVSENEQVGVYNFHLGEAYRKKGDFESARIYLQKAVDQVNKDSPVAKQAAQSLKQLGQ